MSDRGSSGRRVVPLLEKIIVETDQKLNTFHSALLNLRCEGKVAYGRNVRQVTAIIKTLEVQLSTHIRCEEKFLFPFLKKTIPKLEFMIQLLTAEHDGFLRSLNEIEELCNEIGRNESAIGNNRLIQQIYEKGQALIFLLKHHAYLEKNNIHHSISHELKLTERKRLEAHLSKRIKVVT